MRREETRSPLFFSLRSRESEFFGILTKKSVRSVLLFGISEADG